jgi:hypothetical protein
VRKIRSPFAAVGSVALLLLASAQSARAEDAAAGSVMGWVEDSRGLPVAGALVSFFAKGMRGGGLIAFSDDSGHFTLPSLPAGSYTVRAVGRGSKAAQTQRVTVLPNQDAILSLSLASFGELTEKESEEKAREWKWLVRHKTRSVLEQTGTEVAASDSVSAAFERVEQPQLPEIGGSVEVMTDGLARPGSEFSAGDLLSGTGAVRLEGRIADVATFTLGGLVAESEDTTWRMGAEFVVEPGGGHEIRTGTGYGTRYVRPLADIGPEVRLEAGTVGALFIEDRWTINDHVTATFGGRHSYIGFVTGDRNHIDPMLAFEIKGTGDTTILASAEERTIVPGGDLLTLSTLSVAPAIVYADLGGSLSPEHLDRYRLGLERRVGETRIGVRAFREETRDQLVNTFSGPRSGRSLRIDNRGSVTTQGLTIDLGHSIGHVLRGSVAYSFGRVEHDAEGTASFALASDPLGVGPGRFHDVTAQLETFIQPTDTRLVAFYRVNVVRADGPDPEPGASKRNTRFDVQLSQGLPFLGGLTRADWDLLVAVRNLFYESAEGGMLDEMAVLNAPTRVMGGISVRF